MKFQRSVRHEADSKFIVNQLHILQSATSFEEQGVVWASLHRVVAEKLAIACQSHKALAYTVLRDAFASFASNTDGFIH